MKLYWGPHTCAIGIHVLLEEIGLPYETERIDISGGATRKPPLLAVNPKGKVPTLVHDDGSVLTEFAAIATWLARSNPGSGLLPAGPETEARAVEVMAHVEGTIHGQGFARMFMPAMFEPQDVVHGTLSLGQAAVKNQAGRWWKWSSPSSIPNLPAIPTRPGMLHGCRCRAVLGGAVGAAAGHRVARQRRRPLRADARATLRPQGPGAVGRKLSGGGAEQRGVA